MRFLRVTLGGSNDFLRLASEMIPSCCTLLLNRRSIASTLSPSRFLTFTKSGPDSWFEFPCAVRVDVELAESMLSRCLPVSRT